jgi:transcriptional regulator with XRE-family HTH domain
MQSAMSKTKLRKTLRGPGHRRVIAVLVAARRAAKLTQRQLANNLKRPQSFVGRIEAGERRVDIIEFIEIARVLNADPRRMFEQILA